MERELECLRSLFHSDINASMRHASFIVMRGPEMSDVPVRVPESLRHMARVLSWDDAAQLLCLFEGTAIQSGNRPDIRAGFYQQAESMRVLVNTLPYDWNPPEVESKSIHKWIANEVRNHGIPTV